MEKIIECLEKVEKEYEKRVKLFKSAIFENITIKSNLIDDEVFLASFKELKEYEKKINDIDLDFYEKFDTLHNAWIDDCTRVDHLFKSSKSKGLFIKKKQSSYDKDRLQAYYNDLEITTKSVKKITDEMKTKISSLLIQEFLK